MRNDSIDLITIYLEGQNAALMFRHTATHIAISSFEVSPNGSVVLASGNRLRCSFPTSIVYLSSKTFHSPKFLRELVILLYEMSGPLNNKTLGFLTGLLEGMEDRTRRNTKNKHYILKRIGDDVINMSDQSYNIEVEARKPWRRSPIWLTIRVALQLSHMRRNQKCSDPGKHQVYKLVILHILAKLLRAGLQAKNMPNEMLQHMSRKLTRRAAKLEATDATIPGPLLELISETVQMAVSIQQKRFAVVQLATVREIDWPPATTSQLNQSLDTQISMVHSRKYIRNVLAVYHSRRNLASVGLVFNSGPRPISHTLLAHMTLRTDLLESTSASGRKLALKDIELWVETSLEDFVAANLTQQSAVPELFRLLTTYCESAHSLYLKSPLDYSIMLLTASEFWMAIDTIAASTTPLLKEYSCEFNVDMLSTLLLPQKAHLMRLQRITAYLRGRAFLATGPSIFDYHNDLTTESFPVRYYDQSPTHQNLRDTIVQVAMKEQNELRAAELDKVVARWSKLCGCGLRRFELGDLGLCKCVASEKVRYWCNEHQIPTPYRLPLPADELHMKAVIFELDLPIAFAAWRDATFLARGFFVPLELPEELGSLKLFHDPSLQQSDESRLHHKFQSELRWLPEHPILAQYLHQRSQLVFCALDRRTALSPERESPVSYYLTIRSEDTLFQSCRAKCYLANVKGVHLKSHSGKSKRMKLCIFQLPESCAALQYALNSCDHTSNTSIHTQSVCPIDWAIYEYCAFTSLRAGSRLQWLNILRELRAGTLDLNKPEVCLLFQQTIWQTGPQGKSGSYQRDSHEILCDDDFCNAMLSALEDALSPIKANWIRTVSMQILISLGARILCLARSNLNKSRAAHFLRTCRAVCIDWLGGMFRYIDASENDSSVKNWEESALIIALTCRLTFNVDSDDLCAIFNSARDLAEFIECATCIYNFTPKTRMNDYEYFFLRNRDLRLAHRMEHHLRGLVSEANDWFNAALPRHLPTGVPWEVLDAPNERWITTTIIIRPETEMNVYYNLLEGALLFDGVPQALLPPRYMATGLYTRCFQDVSNYVTELPSIRWYKLITITDILCEENFPGCSN